MNEDEDAVLQLLRLMERCEQIERRLLEAEASRMRNSGYERYQRIALARARRAPREELEMMVARQAAELKRMGRAAEIQEAREDAIAAWLNYEGASAYVNEMRKAQSLSNRPAMHGKQARPARWGARDEVRRFVRDRWDTAGTWRNKSAFARDIAPEAMALAEKCGWRMIENNAERMIREWISDKAPNTSTPEP